MVQATLFISARDWLIPAAILFAAGGALLYWAYRRVAAERLTRTACVFLKLLGFAVLAFCLLEPLWSGQRARPGSNYFVLLADNSQGMQIKDREATQTRGEWLRAQLNDHQTTWKSTLEEHFQVRRYLFDSRLQPSRDFSELTFDGRASAIGAALRTIRDRFQGQPLAGILLMTDGNATDLGEGPADLDGLPPVYPILIGKDDSVQDLTLQRVGVTQTAFEDAPVTIQAEVAAAGYAGKTVVAHLFELSGGSTRTNLQRATAATGNPLPDPALKPPTNSVASDPAVWVAEETQKVSKPFETLTFRFQVRPTRPGVVFYRVRVSASEELPQFDHPETSAEATLANNSRVVVVDRGGGPYRVLYVSGRPNWEYKFLKRAVDEDDQVELVGLIRLAKREPKFEFRGRAGESSNPLYRGFDRKTEETERYDQPVLIRLNTRDEFELKGGFPKTAEDLYQYDALIVDDLEAQFFTHDQLSLIEKFVSDRGGGFLMLGGVDSFQHGQYARTPIGDVLPVYMDRAPETRPLAGLQLSLTREGLLQPWVRLRRNEADERSRVEEMPRFQVLNPSRDIKPGGSMLATVTEPGGQQFPALVMQRYGNGRSAALMIGDLWHWGLKNESLQRDLGKAWRQMIRWLVADVPGRIQLTGEPKRDDPNQAILLRVRARDKEFLPLDNANVTLTVRHVHSGSGQTNGSNAVRQTPMAAAATNAPINEIRLAVDPSPNESGLYQVSFVPRESGGYFAEAVVFDSNGVEVGRAETGWTSEPAAEEFRSLKPNRPLLETIARQTGGEMLEMSGLNSFVASLPHRKAPIMESWSFPLWHQPAVFLFALVCFLAEWGLRRWKGLP
ncbi:MAG: glutamine amidotransferase [Verrucomicrobiota bacterium]